MIWKVKDNKYKHIFNTIRLCYLIPILPCSESCEIQQKRIAALGWISNCDIMSLNRVGSYR